MKKIFTILSVFLGLGFIICFAAGMFMPVPADVPARSNFLYKFCIGLDYRIPMQHSLITPAYVRNLKLSPAYNETTFAAEYLGVWLGGSDESWFQFDKLVKYRKLKNPEWHQKFIDDKNVFYLISVDVGRLHDQTVACVFRVNIRDNKYYGTLVNLFVLGRQAESKTFTQ